MSWLSSLLEIHILSISFHKESKSVSVICFWTVDKHKTSTQDIGSSSTELNELTT